MCGDEGEQVQLFGYVRPETRAPDADPLCPLRSTVEGVLDWLSADFDTLAQPGGSAATRGTSSFS